MKFYRPKTLEEAVEVLRRPNSVPVAGGTAFVGKPQGEVLVDLTSINLSYIKEEEDTFRVGATTTISELKESKVAEIAGGVLHHACDSLADTPLQNMITVGGNLVCRHVWTHLPPVLMVIGARVVIAGEEEREAEVDEIVGRGLGSGEIVREVIVPKKSGRGVFKRFALTETDYAVITVAVYSDGREIKVAVGGLCQPTMLDLGDGGKVNREGIERAVSKVNPADHPIFDADYRKEVLKTMIKRSLQEVGRL